MVAQQVSTLFARVQVSLPAPNITSNVMSDRKKQIRAAFRQAVFDRDNHRCKVCGEPNDHIHVPGLREMFSEAREFKECPNCHNMTDNVRCPWCSYWIIKPTPPIRDFTNKLVMSLFYEGREYAIGIEFNRLSNNFRGFWLCAYRLC